MGVTIIRAAGRTAAAVAVLVLVSATASASARQGYNASQIKARVGAYTVAFTPSSGTIVVSHRGIAALQIRELGGNARVNLLPWTRSIVRSGTRWTLTGTAPWARFKLELSASSQTGSARPP